MRLRALAPGKVNLCLFLGGVRADRRHELVTLFESVSLADELTLAMLPRGPDQVHCPGVDGPNLVSAALEALRCRGWDAPPVRIEIAKRIPVAAGMGGGSADAAAALRMAQRLAPLPEEAVAELAAQLGADVPGQLTPGVALGTGAGDLVKLCPPLAAHALLIVPLSQRLSTADVYAEADRLGLPRDSEELEALLRELDDALEPGARLPQSLLVNDLEPAAISLCPQVAPALEAVRDAGADHAFVCGSGPTVAGLYWGPEAAQRAAAAATSVAGRFPGANSAAPARAELSAVCETFERASRGHLRIPAQFGPNR
jgi:4-diphosphocytidyl-2-C-methyl-D-erythritol kinase